MDRKEMVLAIRAELKAKGINSRQVSITSKASLYDDVINATIKDLKVSKEVVEEKVNKYHSVRRCEYSGEVLDGCNVYTNVSFDYEAVRTEREKYIELAKEIIEKYKETPEGQLEVLARKGDLEVLYMPNSYNNNQVVEICKIVKQEYSSNYGEFYNSINDIERYTAHNEFAIAEAMVYIANQFGIDFFAPIPELNEDDLEVVCIPQEEKDRQAKAEENHKEFIKIAEQVKNIQPLKVEDIKEKNIRVQVNFPSLNKNNTLKEYKEELERKYYTNTTLICEIITLSNTDYKLFTNNFLCDCDMIAGKGGNNSDFETDKESYLDMTEEERTQWKTKSYTLGTLVQDEQGNQIIVDCQGYSYARYVGFLEAPFTTPDPEKTTKKESKETNNNLSADSNTLNNKSNLVDLGAYRTNKQAVSNLAVTPANKPFEQATSRQLFALYCATKLITTDLVISKQDASILIGKSKSGKNIKDELKAIIDSQSVSIAK